jgi:hypothetical protein
MNVNNVLVKCVYRVTKLSICSLVGNGLGKAQGSHKAVALDDASPGACNTTKIYVRSYDWPYTKNLRTYGANICVRNIENGLFDRIYSHVAHFGNWQAA